MVGRDCRRCSTRPTRYTDFYWVSPPDTQHSRNLTDFPEVEIVIFDSMAKVGEGEAVYIAAVARAIRDDELETRRSEQRRAHDGSPPMTSAAVRYGFTWLTGDHARSTSPAPTRSTHVASTRASQPTQARPRRSCRAHDARFALKPVASADKPAHTPPLDAPT